MINKNLVILIGRVARDPELRAMPSGQSIVKFSLATNHIYYTQDKQKKETTQFHNCVVFGKSADTLAKYVFKGHELYIEGRIEYRQWKKADNTTAYATEIMVENFQFGAKPMGTTNQVSEQKPEPFKKADPAEIPVIEDDKTFEEKLKDGDESGDVDVKDLFA